MLFVDTAVLAEAAGGFTMGEVDYAAQMDRIRQQKEGSEQREDKVSSEIISEIMRRGFVKPENATVDTASAHLKGVELFDSKLLQTLKRTADPSNWHTAKRGETLSKIAGDDFQRRFGRVPTERERAQYVREIAKHNRIDNPNKISEGQHIQLPPYQQERGQREGSERQRAPRNHYRPQEEYRHRQPVERRVPSDQPVPDRSGSDRDAKEYKPFSERINTRLSPPGTDRKADGSPGDRVSSIGKDHSYRREDDSKVRNYEGKLSDYFPDRTRFKAQDIHDKDGNLIRREIEYDNMNGGRTIEVPDGKGGKEEVRAKKVTIEFNPKTGFYETTVLTQSGDKIQIATDRQGREWRWDPKTHAWKP